MGKRIATLKAFADDAGVVVAPCGPGWGGRYGYTTADYPNCTVAGFRTKSEARQQWAADTFGELAAKALLRLIEAAP